MFISLSFLHKTKIWISDSFVVLCRIIINVLINSSCKVNKTDTNDNGQVLRTDSNEKTQKKSDKIETGVRLGDALSKNLFNIPVNAAIKIQRLELPSNKILLLSAPENPLVTTSTLSNDFHIGPTVPKIFEKVKNTFHRRLFRLKISGGH